MDEPAPGATPFDTLPKAWRREDSSARPPIRRSPCRSPCPSIASTCRRWAPGWSCTAAGTPGCTTRPSCCRSARGTTRPLAGVTSSCASRSRSTCSPSATSAPWSPSTNARSRSADPQARLYQRQFIVVQEPVRSYRDRALPMIQIRVRPLVTPNLDPSGGLVPAGRGGAGGPAHGRRAEVPVRARLPRPRRTPSRAACPAAGGPRRPRGRGRSDRHPGRLRCRGGYSRRGAVGHLCRERHAWRHRVRDPHDHPDGTPGAPGARTSSPRLKDADVVVPAMRHLSTNCGSVLVKYAGPYLVDGFSGRQRRRPGTARTGDDDHHLLRWRHGSIRGFVQPDLPIRGLSRLARGCWATRIW